MKIAAIAAALLATASAAQATPYLIAGTGRVTSEALVQNDVVSAAPAGSIKVGDAITVYGLFDTGTAEVTSLYDADPTINIYDLPGSALIAGIGSYATAISPMFDFNASFQLWNNHQVGGPTDSQSFYFFNYQHPAAAAAPFNLGAGSYSESVAFDSFDSTATARDNDLITDIAPESRFSSKTFTYDLLNATTGASVVVDGSFDFTLTSLAGAVPEPGTWATMLVGLGAVGGALRRRRTPVGRTSVPA